MTKKKIASIALIENYAYGMSKNLLNEKEEIECNAIRKQYKMINFDDVY